jgi:hypothetical protein
MKFRQPASTLCNEEGTENVRLFTALIREAERRTHLDLSLNQAIGTCIAELDVDKDKAMDLPAFLSVLGFNQRTKTYWEDQVITLDRQRWEANRLPVCLKDWKKCSECYTERDNVFTDMLVNRIFHR